MFRNSKALPGQLVYEHQHFLDLGEILNKSRRFSNCLQFFQTVQFSIFSQFIVHNLSSSILQLQINTLFTFNVSNQTLPRVVLRLRQIAVAYGHQLNYTIRFLPCQLPIHNSGLSTTIPSWWTCFFFLISFFLTDFHRKRTVEQTQIILITQRLDVARADEKPTKRRWRRRYFLVGFFNWMIKLSYVFPSLLYAYKQYYDPIKYYYTFSVSIKYNNHDTRSSYLLRGVSKPNTVERRLYIPQKKKNIIRNYPIYDEIGFVNTVFFFFF